MSEKSLRASIWFLGAVVALYLVARLAGGGGGGGADTTDSDLAGAFADMDGESLSVVEIEGPEDTIRLERDGDAWTVNGFEADSSAVARFLRAIDEVEVAAVVATNPANHARLGVTADSAWALTADGAGTVLLGNAGNRFRTSYARLPDTDRVSLIEGDLRSAAARPLFDWRNKIVLQADTAAVASIHVTRDGRQVVYQRQDSTWATGDEEADATTIRNILQELAGLRASGFAPQDAEMPDEPDRIVQAMDAAGNEVAAVALVEEEANFRVSTPASPYIFEIPSFRADRIAPAPPDDS